MPTTRELARIYKEAHNIMRNVDGLQPQEAFDELLKYLFFKQNFETSARNGELIADNAVRRLFSAYVEKANSWSSEAWREKKIFLSKECLSDIHGLLFPIEFSKINYDTRSQALKEFLTPEIRKGLGIFLTPDDVVASMVGIVPNGRKLKILDPACGSGTFLIEYLKKLDPRQTYEIYGAEKSPRMLLLADLNLGHLPKVKFKKELTDALKTPSFEKKFDVVLTNPPFGVHLDARDYDFSGFLSCKDSNGYQLKKQTSEIVFIEKCFQQLKPGGTLGIVIPKSIATNNSLQAARKELSKYGYIYAIMSLPPETFVSTGAQTTTIVLFAKKYKNKDEKKEATKLALATIDNVGFDSSGRPREGSQLPRVADAINKALGTGKSHDFVEMINYSQKADTFAALSNVFISQVKRKNDLVLGDICQVICTGRTPSRKDYTEAGNFLVKVGNLTGYGINWEARDRNFISDEEIQRRLKTKKPLTLKKNDILLTSSAHSPVYIAKKSDIFTGVPAFLKTKYVSFVGEVMLIRVDEERIDPYLLLAFLRSNKTISSIQKMVRGQTAHLHPADISQLVIPRDVFMAKGKYNKASKIIKEQNRLSVLMNGLMVKQAKILGNLKT